MPYRRWSTLLLLILHEESRLVPFPGLQKPSVFFRIYSSMLLLSGSEIFLVLVTARRGARFARIHFADFFFLRCLARGGEFLGLCQRLALLLANLEGAPLRRIVA